MAIAFLTLTVSDTEMNDIEKIKNIAALECEAFSNPWTLEMIQSSMASDFDHVEVMGKDGIFQGYIIYSVVCDSADLLRVAAKSEYRRQGIGTSLMEMMIKDCEKLGVQNIFLEVRQSNAPAIGMYGKFGFQEISRRKRYYTSPVEDGIVMQKEMSI